MSDQVALVGEGKSTIRIAEENGSRLPDMAMVVMKKMIAAHELQEGCDSGGVYMSESAQLEMWREVYAAYATFISSAPAHADQRGHTLLTALAYVLSVWGRVETLTWTREWTEATQHARAYMADHWRAAR